MGEQKDALQHGGHGDTRDGGRDVVTAPSFLPAGLRAELPSSHCCATAAASRSRKW